MAFGAFEGAVACMGAEMSGEMFSLCESLTAECTLMWPSGLHTVVSIAQLKPVNSPRVGLGYNGYCGVELGDDI